MNYTIPVWQVGIFLATQVIGLALFLVRLYISDQKKNQELKSIKISIVTLEAKVDRNEENYKKEIHELYATIRQMNDTLVQVKTLTELLVVGKIKTAERVSTKT